MKRMLSEAECRQVEEAVAAAERETSGEIVVCLQQRAGTDIEVAARDFFVTNGLTATARRNAVLILVAWEDRQLAVLGDEGIDAQVPPDFWETTVAVMGARFATGDLAGGLVAGIHEVGARLREFFPPVSDDINELPDTVREDE